MSRLPELSSTEPTLIGLPCANAVRGRLPATVAAPAAVRKSRLVNVIGIASPVMCFLDSGLLGRLFGRLGQRRGEVVADGLPDALQRRQLQRHAEDAVHHLV